MFGRRVLFRVDDHLPDPEDQKWRFRRWVVVWSFLFTLGALAIPVVTDLIPYFSASREARRLAHEVLISRQTASLSRQSVSLTLDQGDHIHWIRRQHTSGQCDGESTLPPQELQFGETVMRIQFRPEGSGDVKEVRRLCLHSHDGLLADGAPVANGKVLVQVFPLEDARSGRTDRATQILMDQFGASVSLVHN